MSKRTLLFILCLPLVWYVAKEGYRLARPLFQGGDPAEETVLASLRKLDAEVKSKWSLRPTMIAGIRLEVIESDEPGSESDTALSAALSEYATKINETRALLRSGRSGNQKLDEEAKKLLEQEPLADAMDGKIAKLLADMKKSLPIPTSAAEKTKPNWSASISLVRELSKENDVLAKTYFKHRAASNERTLQQARKLLDTLNAAATEGVQDNHFAVLESLVKETEGTAKDGLIAPLAKAAALRWLVQLLPEPKYEDEAWIHNGTKWARHNLDELKIMPSFKKLSTTEELQFQHMHEGKTIVTWFKIGIGEESRKCPTPKSLVSWIYKKIRGRERTNFKTMSVLLVLVEKEYTKEYTDKYAGFAKLDKTAPVRDWESLRKEPYPEFWGPLERIRGIASNHPILCRDDGP